MAVQQGVNGLGHSPFAQPGADSHAMVLLKASVQVGRADAAVPGDFGDIDASGKIGLDEILCFQYPRIFGRFGWPICLGEVV